MNRSPAGVSSATFELKVRSYELDVYGHVNNAVYQSWFEEGREAVLRAAGTDYDHFPRTTGLYFVVARTEIDFRSAARRGDAVVVRSTIVRIGDRSVTFRQTAARPGGVVYASATTVMCFAREGRAEPVPAEFRARFVAEL